MQPEKRPTAPPDDPDRQALGFVGTTDPMRYRAPPASFDPEEKNGIVRAMVRPGSRVLDVGCGTGATLRELRDALGCRVVGVEPNARRAEAARAEGIPVLEGTLESLDPASAGRFDALLLLDVLEHLSDPAALLAQARDWLAPDGCVIASVPNVAHWTVRLDLLRGRFDYTDAGIMDATHLRWFTGKTFRQLFDGAGYRIDASHASSGNWLPVYGQAPPWKWLGHRRRTRLVHRCKRWWPQLFGCQHVIQARPVR
jgi:methionine biosynthesis protein MetW